MFAVFIGGLWLVLDVGRSSKAPDDLAGDWTVTWETSPPPLAVDPSMHVSQSGRFFVVRFGQKSTMNMTLQPGWSGARDGRTLQMSLAGEGWLMNLSGNIPLSDQWHAPIVKIDITGPSRHVGVARRNGFSAATRPSGVARAR